MAAPAPVPAIADFLEEFPEFSEVRPPVVQAALNRAARHVDPVIWKAKASDGVMYKAAHFLTLSPFGMSTKMSVKFFADNETTTYGAQFNDMLLEVAGGFVVAGGGRRLGGRFCP